MQGYTGTINSKCLYDEWMRALAEGFIIIREGKTEGVGKGQAILLASYMCGPCDSRLLGVYPEGQPFAKPKKDLHVTFERVFEWNPAFTRDDLAKAGFTPTCAYVWEFAKWHVEDQAAKRGKFPSVAENILPEISDTTVFVYDSRCNRRIARAMGKVITYTEWLDYYTERGDTSAPICAKSIVDTLSKRQGNDKSLLVYCINLILREKTDECGSLHESNIARVVSQGIEDMISFLEVIASVHKQMRDVVAMFGGETSDHASAFGTIRAMYDRVETAIKNHLQQTLSNMRAQM